MQVFVILASGGGTVVEHSPHHPKGVGLSPVPATGTGRENGEEILNSYFCQKIKRRHDIQHNDIQA